MKNLHILRHAKTNPFSSSGKDIDRELLPKGIKQALLFRKEKASCINNIKIICSPSQRTKQTLELIKSNLGYSIVEYVDILYLASSNEIESLINKQGKAKEDLFIIGHNFGLSDLVSSATNKDIYLKTCEYVCLQININYWEEYVEGLGKISDSFKSQTS